MAEIDYNQLMQNNIARVFNERDADRRLAAIRGLYAEDATLYEPQDSATGHAAINDAVIGWIDAHELSRSKDQAPIRVAVTGRTVGAPLWESLAVLGRGRTLERLRAARARL